MAAKASERAVKPSVSINEWGIFKGGEITPTNATYTCQLNSPPSMSLGYAVTPETADNVAIETKSTAMLRRLGQQQITTFEGKKVPDALAILRADEQDDSDGLYFYGFACCDTFGVSAGNISTSGTAAVQWTELEALNYSIYEITEENTVQYSSGIEGESFMDIVLNLEKKLYESWDKIYANKNPENEQQLELKKKIHKRNGELRHYFQTVLKDSKQTIGWPKINKYLSEDKRTGGDASNSVGLSLRASIATAVCKILQNGGGSFLGQLLQIGELFQCLFVPTIISQVPGKFINKAIAVGSKAEPLELDIINFSGRSASSFGLLPVSHVFLEPPPPNNTVVYDREKGIGAPKEAAEKGGAQIKLPFPPWWFPSINTISDVSLKDATKSPKEGKREVMINETVYPKVKENIKDAKEQTDIEFDVGYMWAMVCYAWSVLAGSTASITVPGTFKIEPGKRYEVKNSKGESMFTGFLTGFSTSISPGSCLTNLVFSHIMFPGFKLPGADELKAAGILSE